MISLKCLNKKELEKFIISGEFETFDFLPITKHRALSQIKNPNAGENDVLLTLAFSGDQLAGYLGTFPDLIGPENEKIKFAWLSTLYVDHNFRGQRIAQQLLEKVFEKYGNKIAITEFTIEAETLYGKTRKFEYREPKKGIRFYFRSNLQMIIPAKKPQLSFARPLFKTADWIINSIILQASKKTKANNFTSEVSKSIDEESEKFAAKFSSNRNTENLRWILENPWILEGNYAENSYQFSSFSPEFNYFWVKIFDENKILKTCALLQSRNHHLKIPYLFSDNNIEFFVEFLAKFIKEKKIKTLICYHKNLNEKLILKGFSKLYQKSAERRYLFHQDLLKALPKDFEPNFQDGDGDPVFT